MRAITQLPSQNFVTLHQRQMFLLAKLLSTERLFVIKMQALCLTLVEFMPLILVVLILIVQIQAINLTHLKHTQQVLSVFIVLLAK
jgi:hypothetical protein